jgi:hypothetical protein
MTLAVTLDDKYVLERGRVYLTGTQALVRLADDADASAIAAAGLNTAGYMIGLSRLAARRASTRRCGRRKTGSC